LGWSGFSRVLQYPDLKRAVIAQAKLHGATTVAIEDHASGTQLIQDLRREGGVPVEPRKSTGDKKMRMASQTAPIEGGFVYAPREAHWLPEYLHELSVFPNGKYDDQVDSTSQALATIGNPNMKAWGFYELMRRRVEARNRELGIGQPEEICYAIGSMEYAAREREREAAKAEEAAAVAAELAAAAEADKKAA
jgi:predicted phage terminase large subunit-like protein